MSWTSPVMRCPACHHVGKPKLVEGATKYTLTASCTACKVIIKSLPRLRGFLSQDKPQ